MREIIVRAKPSSTVDLVDKVTDSEFVVRTKEPPVQGRANRAIMKLLAEYFGIPLSRVSIIRGHASRNKTVVIP